MPPGRAAPPTGLLFPTQSVEALVEALRRFESDTVAFEPKALRRHAETFDRPVFKERMEGYLTACLARAAC